MNLAKLSSCRIFFEVHNPCEQWLAPARSGGMVCFPRSDQGCTVHGRDLVYGYTADTLRREDLESSYPNGN